jgi:hypothetical protein
LTVRVGSLSERGLEGNGGLVAERGVEAVGVVDVLDEGADATARAKKPARPTILQAFRREVCSTGHVGIEERQRAWTFL